MPRADCKHRLPRMRERLCVAAAIVLAAVGFTAATAAADLAPVRSGVELGRSARDFAVARGPQQIFAREYPGRGPALVLLHGFPDNSHLYDALVPRLRGRRVVTFDFLGWGRSDKPQRRRYTFAGQLRDLEAVIGQLGLRRVELVAHDAGVPAAVNWALDHPQQTASLTLMNGFYAPAQALRPPALIALLVLGRLPRGVGVAGLPRLTESLGPLGRRLMRDPALFRSVFSWQQRQFMTRPADARRFTPLFLRQFQGPRSSLVALRSLTRDLIPTVAANAGRVPALAAAPFPLRLIWGGRDRDLNVGVAQDLRQQVPRAELHVLAGARHNLQIDQPGRIADLLRRARQHPGRRP